MKKAHIEFMLNVYTFWNAEILSGYRPGIWRSSSGNQQVLKAICSNIVVNIPTAGPVTEHKGKGNTTIFTLKISLISFLLCFLLPLLLNN
jgi:hypothetical protein